MTGGERLAPDARVLVIHVARIGDTLLITPALRALKGALPQGSLTVLAHPARRALLEHLSFIDVLGSITAKRSRLRGWLPRNRYDLAIVYGLDAPLIHYAKRVSRRVIAFEQPDPNLTRKLDLAVPPPRTPRHAVHERLLPVEALGITATDLRLAYTVTAIEQEAARRWCVANLPEHPQPLIGLQVSSFPTKAYRDWPPESFAELGRKLLAEFPNACFLILGGTESRDKAGWLAGQLPRTVSAAGQLSLRETAALLRQVDLYVGVDTGPTHLSGALGVPMVALYHCRHPGRLLTPLNHEHLAVIEHPESDSDCERETPMANISVDSVFKQARRLLAGMN